jgi:hypothetical protein
MSTKRQVTMAKREREQAVRDRRARKQLKRAERKAEKLRTATAGAQEGETREDEAPQTAPLVEPAESEQAEADEKSDEQVGWPLRAPGERPQSATALEAAEQELASLVQTATDDERNELREIQPGTGWRGGGGLVGSHGNPAAALALIATAEDRESQGGLPLGSAQRLRDMLSAQLA